MHMEFELECVSAAGDRLAKLAERHAQEFAVTAADHDRRGTFPHANWVELGRSGFLSACVPEDLGGLGVTGVRDLVVAIGRLARGDGSTAIGAAMHTTALWYLARLRGSDQVGAEPGLGRGLELMLRACARGRVVACVAISEQGTTLGRPRTMAEPDGAGYRLVGRKFFCTNSPAATVFLTSVRLPGDGGPDRLGFALVPRGTPGLTVAENWDALGMRASGSGEVVFDGCPLPAQQVMPAGPIGRIPQLIFPLTVIGALVLASAFLGMAEQIQATVIESAARRRREPGGPPVATIPAVQSLVAENEVDLAAGRAVIQRTAALLDSRLDPAAPDPDRQVLHHLMGQAQCANMMVKRSAVAVADRALTASGGGGYLSGNVLSRYYRDVRAGPFMQPFSALDAFPYIGRVALGLDPETDA
jgi:alkylation response protein AidB-like acyl-CoA dehydrogenase